MSCPEGYHRQSPPRARRKRFADALRAVWTFLGPSNMLAYLAMMAPRLVELRRVPESYLGRIRESPQKTM